MKNKKFASIILAGIFFLEAIFAFVVIILMMSGSKGCSAKAGGGSWGGDTADHVTINVAGWSSSSEALERAGIECFSDAFTSIYPNVTVNVDILPYYVENFYTNMVTNSGKYDVFLVPDGYFGSWVVSDTMMDLTQLVAESDIVNEEDIYANVMTRYKYDAATHAVGSGKIYALPKDVGPYVMYYNTSMLKKYTVEGHLAKNYPTEETIYNHYKTYLQSSTTFPMSVAEEMWYKIRLALDNDGKTAKEKKYFPVAGVQIEGLVWSNGADFINDAVTPAVCTMNQTKVKEAYEHYVKWYNDGIMPDSGTSSLVDAVGSFQNQQCAMLITGRWQVSNFRNNSSLKWDVCPVPGFDSCPEINSSSGSVGFAVAKSSEHGYWAWKFVEYCASLEGQIVATESGFCIPMYNTPEAISALREADAGLMPNNTELFIYAAEHQHRNRQSYLAYSISWVSKIDKGSGYIFLKPGETGYKTVQQFLTTCSDEVDSTIRNDYYNYIK